MLSKSSKKQYNYLECLPDQLAAYKTRIEAFSQDELNLFSKRLEKGLLRQICSPAGRQSVTTSNRSGDIPELLSLDGLRHESKGSKKDLRKQLISVQVREFHIVDQENQPAVLYTVTSAFAGGYHATVYRMQKDIDALYKMFGRRACVAPFTAPAVTDSKSLAKSCASLRKFLLAILRCPAALGNNKLFAWFGLDRAFSSSREDDLLLNAFEDVWRLHYSDNERIFSDSPEDMMTLYLTSRVKEQYAAVFADIRKQGVEYEMQCIKCIMFYVRRGVCDMWYQWRETARVLVRKFALLPENEFDDALEDALAAVKKQCGEALAPFNGEAIPAMKSLLNFITPLAKAVRHTMREYRPRKNATFAHLLTAQPNEVADYKFENLDKKLSAVKSKVKGALEHSIQKFERDLSLNVKAEGGEKSAAALLIPFMRKIPVLARACFYLSQPTVMTTFMKNFVLERERLCACVPTGNPKDRSPIDAFADRMSQILTFLERDLSFSDFCVKSDFADEILQTHERDKTLPTNGRFSYTLRTFYNMLSRIVTLRMQFFVNMTKMFVNTVNDMGLDTVVSLQLRIAMVRTASLNAYREANLVFERHLFREIPDMVLDLTTAMLITPAMETVGHVLPGLGLAVARSKDAAFNAFLDVDNLVELALTTEIRSSIEPTVSEWWKVGMNKREYDPARTDAAVAKRKNEQRAEQEKKKEQEDKKAAEAAKAKKKKSKAAPDPEPVPEKPKKKPERQPEKEPEPEPEPEKPKKKAKKKQLVAA